ncbi:MAG: uncharacterized membrane protein YjjP (DUF1212 family) [Cognaticolwellia sp.]|jgi:uncharacterized membrane protein YjjP (DUF1212 family)
MMQEDYMPATPVTTQLVVGLARTLHESGAPSHRLEDTLEGVCGTLDIDVVIFSLPTALMLQVDGQTHMIRVSPRESNLSRLVAVDALGAALSRERLSVGEALSRLKVLEEQKAGPYSATVMAIALAVSSGIAGLLFGGPPIEAFVAGTIGGMLSLLSGRMARNPHHARIAHWVYGTLAALLAGLAASIWAISPERAALAALIIFIPGLSLTTAIAELASGHLSAGSARFAGGAIVLLQLGLGCALGLSMASAVLDPALGPVAAAPDWLRWPVVLTAGVSFAILFQARKADLLWIVVAAVIAVQGTGLAVELLGPRAGPGIGAFLVALFSNAQARIRDLPASVTLVPGILLLVPGAIGFRSMQALTQAQTLLGLSSLVEMLVIAAALVGGLLAANAVFSARRPL